MPDTTPPELLRLIFGQAANTMGSIIVDRLYLWADAFDAWLDERQRLYNRNARSVSHCAWRDFLAFKKKAPWEMYEADVLEWVKVLEDRGLRPSTINQRLTALTKFYVYCQEHGIDGGRIPDPAANVPRLKERKYASSLYLNEDELQALLGAIDHQHSLIGKRDYAMILALLATGLKPKELRELRWGSLAKDSGVAGHAPPEAKVALPPAVWSATLDFLKSSGRLAGMQAESYLFVPLADPLLKAPTGQPEDWKDDQPVSAALLKFVLKRYAAAAGLRVELVTCHTLRHTAAVLRLQAGDELEGVQSFLGRQDRAKTQGYLDELASQPRPDLWHPDGHAPPIQRGPMRAGPGNLMAFKHGFYASHLPGESPEDAVNRGLEAEIDRMRYVMDYVFEAALFGSSKLGPVQLLEIYGKAVTRLANLMRVQQNLIGEKPGLEETILQAIREVGQEMDLKI